MSQPILSILIPITPDRKEAVQPILKKVGLGFGINHYMDNGEWSYSWFSDDGELELRIYQDNKELTIGEKRERLYQQSSGVFAWQVDSDDDIAGDAIEIILKAIKENPDVDCITFEERCQMNGQLYCANHSLRYGGWEGDGSRLLPDGYHFHRTPFYKNVIKTSIAQSVPFERIRFGEDHAWSIAIYPHLKTEIHIPKQLYYYIYEPKESHNERYGITE